MELALYCPVYGYYEKEADSVGRRGDFFTSVSVGPLFGQLLALQFADWLDVLLDDAQAGRSPDFRTSRPSDQRSPRPWFQIVEAGAHQGDLAADILEFFQESRPELFERLEYWIIEPSERRRLAQCARLKQFSGTVRWLTSLTDIRHIEISSAQPSSTAGSVNGVIFSNELLDAMPIHRFAWDSERQAWFELAVTFEDERFVWTRTGEGLDDLRALDTSGANGRLQFTAELQQALPDGFIVESSPAAAEWWAQASNLLSHGKLVTIDYGDTEANVLRPEAGRGSVRGYSKHQLVKDVLANPGEQDITANVRFAELKRIGEAAGLATYSLNSQEEFLTAIAAPVLRGERQFAPWNAKLTRQFQTLTSPAHLGRLFRVLVQGR